LYDVERWIAAGKPLQGVIAKKKTLLQIFEGMIPLISSKPFPANFRVVADDTPRIVASSPTCCPGYNYAHAWL
jgi:hypothetical protein